MEAAGAVLLARGKPCRNLKEAAENYRALLDLPAVFARSAPVELEVGCGNGGFIAALARRTPSHDFLAAELCTNVVLTAMERVVREGIPNVRFLNIPAEILACYIPPHTISRIYLNFSTPLPEAGREKQRLTSDRFLAIYRELLVPNGSIVQKTDSVPFFEYSLRKFRENGFTVEDITYDLHASVWAAENIETEYERSFAAKGVKICRAVAVLNAPC